MRIITCVSQLEDRSADAREWFRHGAKVHVVLALGVERHWEITGKLEVKRVGASGGSVEVKRSLISRLFALLFA